MWGIVDREISVPIGFPEQIEVPDIFLHQINNPTWLWVIRITLIVLFCICIFYSCDIRINQYIEGSRKEKVKEHAIKEEETK